MFQIGTLASFAEEVHIFIVTAAQKLCANIVLKTQISFVLEGKKGFAETA